MRKTVKILGIGQAVSGTSKTGKAYAFTPVSFAYPDEGFDGYKAETANMDLVMIADRGGIKVNEEYDVIFHYQNFRPVVDAIL